MRQKKSRTGCGKIVLSNNANPIIDVGIDDNDNDSVSPQKLDIQRVTASSNHPGPYGCENVLNERMGQDGGADWSTHGEGPGAWIQLDLGWPTMHTVTQLRFAGRVRDDKFKTVRLSFSDGSSQELEFPNNTLLNSFDLSPAVSTTFVRITCLTCYNTSHPNRGAQAIELWGFGKTVTGQLGVQASRSGGGAGEIITDVQTVLSVHGNAVEEADEGIPVITFRRGDDDDNDICAIIDGSTLNKNSTMESVMESEDVCQELGVVGLLSEYKFFVKRKEEKSSSIPLRWNQFRSMTVHKLSRLQNIDTNYLVTMKEKSVQCKVEKAKLEDLSEKVLSVSKLVNELINSNPEGDRTRRIPLGNYYIKTTYHERSGQAAGWGLSAWQLHGGARNSASSWVATHEGAHWPCVWSVEAGKKPNTYRIKTHQHLAGGQPAGWGLSAWQLHGGQRNGGSSRVAVHNGDHWPMDWEIVPGKKDGTWRVLTTEHAAGGQPAGWGLSSWGPKVADTRRNGGSSWVHVHVGDEWPMDWVFERVETHDKVPCDVKVAIRSVSSGNYLDGRDTNHPSNKQAWLTNRQPQGDRFLHWIIEKVDDNYALKSLSSGFYLDGRNPSFRDRDGAVTMCSRKPQGDKFLQWQIEKVDGNFALKSVSSGLYLDGRNPVHIGNQVWLTARPPQGDRYLQWNFSRQ